VHDALAMAKVKGISDSQYYLRDLTLILASMKIVRRIELSTFAILHHDIEESRIVVNLIYFNNVGMFKLYLNTNTKSRI
jgi:hypothetical protein